MSQLISNSFTQYLLTEQEQIVGCALNQEQTMLIQNDLSLISQQKLQLEVDPNNYAAYVQQEAFLAGQIKILSHLLDRSEASIRQQKEEAEVNRNS